MATLPGLPDPDTDDSLPVEPDQGPALPPDPGEPEKDHPKNPPD